MSEWTLDAIRALRDGLGNEAVRTDIYQTADPGHSQRSIKLTFEDGHQRSWFSHRRGPWIEDVRRTDVK